MTVRFLNGREVRLGPPIAQGGEGVVYDLPDRPGQCAKVYHAEKLPEVTGAAAKLKAMVALQDAGARAAAAWPLMLLNNENRQLCGFVMDRVDGPGVIDRLIHPQEQAEAFPGIGYDFLVHVAENLLIAASALHKAGVVIGDVNESNVFVQRDGTVRFIDADSFQIRADREVHRCLVGKAEFTPPELAGASFRDLDRTPDHDRFGLAIMVFQLLCGGSHLTCPTFMYQQQ